MRIAITSYFKILRLIFVVFSLFLMGDAFYRWDGFKYYLSFVEFLPSVALVMILWSITAAITAILLWLILLLFKWFCQYAGWRTFEPEFFIICTLILGVLAWTGKILIFAKLPTYGLLKIVVFFCVIFLAILVTYLFRNKSVLWVKSIQERIAPLVWLFGILFLFSLTLVIYHTCIKQNDNLLPHTISQSSLTEKSRPNIILVTFDTLTARDMSVYGYNKTTTPFISKWAKESSLFTRVEAASNWTGSTTASLMTGKRVWTHQKYHSLGFKPVKSSIENLPKVMQNHGYYTIALIQNPIASVKALGVSGAFDIAPIETEFIKSPVLMTPGFIYGSVNVFMYNIFNQKIEGHDWIIRSTFILGKLWNVFFSQDYSETPVPNSIVFNRFLEIIGNNTPEPYFAWIHLYPPHSPYLPPQPYKGVFDSSPKMMTFENEMLGRVEIGRFVARNGYLPEDIEILRARYNEFIAYCDKQFQDFISELSKRNKLNNTVIILSSDHGESFEHNVVGFHGHSLYESETHIPLLIKEPDQTEPIIINDLVEQIDIPATILDLAFIQVPEWMEGRSLLPIMRGEKLATKPVFSMHFPKNPSRWHEIESGKIAIWDKDYKLIHFLEDEKSLLFNIKKDPDELVNLFEKNPNVGQRLLSVIQDNLKKANDQISRGE